MTVLLLCELAVIVAAFIGMLHLKRAGERAWRVHQARARRREIVLRIIADPSRFIAGMQQAVAAAADLEREMRRARGPFEKVGRELDAMAARIRKAMRESIPDLHHPIPNDEERA